MKKLLPIILTCISLQSYAQPATETAPDSNVVNKRNTFTVTVGSGVLFPTRESRYGIARISPGSLYSAGVEYNFKKKARNTYFSLGVQATYGSLGYAEPPVKGEQSFSMFFYSTTFNMNIPFKLTDDLNIILQLSAVPSYIKNNLPKGNRIHRGDLALQGTVMASYKRFLVGIRMYRPIGSYSFGDAPIVDNYKLNCLSGVVGFQLR